MYQKEVLSNGLHVITATMPHTRTASIGIFVGVGSRYEKAEKAGVSHFVEHLCFKGTQRRATTREISEAIEGVGGILNGSTDKELSVYWCKVALLHLPLALDVLADMLRHSKFDPQDIERERQVIIEEINMIQDSPQQRADLLIDELLWPDQPLGRDVAGSKETVGALIRSDMWDCLVHQYLPNNAVVSIAGDIDHDEVVSRIEKAFSGWQPGSPLPWYPASDNQQAPRHCIEPRDIEQAHLCLAVRGLPFDHPDRFNLDMLSVILGEGMSSRLFTEIRERRGLAYSIHSSVDHFLDSGSLIICAGVTPKHLPDTVVAILEELHHLGEGVPEAELAKAKELCKGRLLLRMEDSYNVVGWLGVQELLLGKVLSVDEAVSIVDSIQSHDLQRVAQQLLIAGKLNLAVVGPVRNEERLENLLRL
jgi:predicted Zn-dependent peptidase